MRWNLATHSPVGLLSVSCFLAGLLYLASLLYFDSYKHVSIRWVLFTIAIGSALVVVRHFINGAFALPWKHSSICYYNAAGASDSNALLDTGCQ